MISNEELESAVAAGVVDARTADALRSHVASLRHAPEADEEHFRLVTGFNDIFVVIASLLLLVSLAWIGRSASPWVGALATSAGGWGLAEYFVRRRGMALPAIVLLVAFVGGVFVAVEFLLLGLVPPSHESPGVREIVAAAAATAAAWVHWRRFRVPITVAAGAVMAVVAACALVTQALPAAGWLLACLFLSGLVVLALAVRWDASDPARTTRRSDVAFWLHLAAAPMIVHPVFLMLNVTAGDNVGTWQVVAAVALYLLIGAMSVVLDRRALMVSALSYVLYAFAAALEHAGFVVMGFAITALIVGALLLLLSAFWQAVRSRTVGLLPVRLHRWVAPVRVE